MPIYEYQCKACGAALEKLQKISEPLLVECPECGHPALVKQVSAPSFRLKGTGWYETDFKTGKKKLGTADRDEGSNAGNGKDNSAGSKATEAGNGAGKSADAAESRPIAAKSENTQKAPAADSQ
jgi:putative FmdB family regulatory protein